MRRAVLLMLVGCALLAPAGASAKFGISKTRLTLTRYRPPDVVLLGDTVAVRVVSDSRAVTNAHLSLVRTRLEDALRAWNVVRLVDSGEAQVRLRVGYEDDAGKARVATLEASLGEGPGGWSPWLAVHER